MTGNTGATGITGATGFSARGATGVTGVRGPTAVSESIYLSVGPTGALTFASGTFVPFENLVVNTLNSATGVMEPIGTGPYTGVRINQTGRYLISFGYSPQSHTFSNPIMTFFTNDPSALFLSTPSTSQTFVDACFVVQLNTVPRIIGLRDNTGGGIITWSCKFGHFSKLVSCKNKII